MTYLRKWDARYLADLGQLPDEALRTKVRSMTTLLAGNPFLEPSSRVQDAVRAIDVQGRAVLMYRIEPCTVLRFLRVFVYGTHLPKVMSREVLEELRHQI
jgi:hypothetical protein